MLPASFLKGRKPQKGQVTLTRRFYRKSSPTARFSSPAIGVVLLTAAFLVAIPPAARGATTITVTTTGPDAPAASSFPRLRSAEASRDTPMENPVAGTKTCGPAEIGPPREYAASRELPAPTPGGQKWCSSSVKKGRA